MVILTVVSFLGQNETMTLQKPVKVGTQNVPLFYALQLVTYGKLHLFFHMKHKKCQVSTCGYDRPHKFANKNHVKIFESKVLQLHLIIFIIMVSCRIRTYIYIC